jgi:transcriptional regulator with XRE-family HTH domain
MMAKRKVWTMDMIKQNAQDATRSDKRPAADPAKPAGAGRGRRRRGKDGPDPIDIYVGSRLRERRVSLGMSQTVLADRLGLTFQQVQKYERGANRLSASALWRAADAVDVPVSYFFDGLSQGHAVAADDQLDVIVLKLTQKIRKLDPSVREKLSALIAVLSREEA